MSTYALQAYKFDTLSGAITNAATSFTLQTGSFGTPTGPQLLAIDYNDATKKEIILGTINGTSVTSVTRGVDGTTAQAHSASAPVTMVFTPTHYQALVDGTGWSTSAITIGEAEIATNFSSTVVTTPTSVTGLSITVTVPVGGRRMKLEAFGNYMSTTATGNQNVSLYLFEGATQLAQSLITSTSTGMGLAAYVSATFVPSAGTHTYNVAMSQSAAGSMVLNASSNSKSYILATIL